MEEQELLDKLINKQLSDEEMNAALHHVLQVEPRDGVVHGGLTDSDGRGFATGHHLVPIYLTLAYLRKQRKITGFKKSALEFIAEFVHDRYSAEILSFVLGTYKGEDLTQDVEEEIIEALCVKLDQVK